MAYYDLNPLLSRGAKFNFATGGRGTGKSYAWKQDAFGRWERNREEWVLLRRFDVETESNKKHFWRDFLPSTGYETRSRGMDALIRKRAPAEFDDKERQEWYQEHRWEPFGYYLSLNASEFYKGIPFDNVTNMLFDEFIRKNRGYLKNEVDEFLDVVETVFRRREKARVIAFSNAGKMNNPYYEHYGVKAKDLFEATSGFIRRNKGQVLFQYYNPEPEEIRSIVRLAGTESYKAHAYGNQFSDAGNEMVVPKPKVATPMFKITKDGEKWLTVYRTPLGRWVDYGNPDIPGKYTMDSLEVVPSAPYVAQVTKSLRVAFDTRQILFASPDVRNLFLDWL